MADKKTVYLIGNAHIDPVWLWRFQEGFAEIKASFRSALDRIKEYDDFIFTSACASYYKWVEENCPEMFEEIRQAVKDGKWCFTGGMWVQPDCNIPSTESFARHMLYSQRYFYEKFGRIAVTGYNVDSFGHTAGMPSLLKAGGMSGYAYMRPANGAEMEYPFHERTFRWRCGNDEILAFHIKDPYCIRINDKQPIIEYDDLADAESKGIMMFYGVGNHGGGPTKRNIDLLHEHAPECKNIFRFSSPDEYFADHRNAVMPIYSGELQNHASGCYSANSLMKAMNRAAENRLTEAERMCLLADNAIGFKCDPAPFANAWEGVIFNQFHDIICGCSVREAYYDAYAFNGAAIAQGLKLSNAAAQRISWNIDTWLDGLEGGERSYVDSDKVGSPIVVFNPLSHPVKIPVDMAHMGSAAAVTDPDGKPVDFQVVRADYTNGSDLYAIRFIAEVPAYGWSMYTVYRDKTFEKTETKRELSVSEHALANDKVTLQFDPKSGIGKLCKSDGAFVCGNIGKAIVIDDSHNDTWAHNRFVFDDQIGEFTSPEFKVLEDGDCQVSLLVRSFYKNSTLEQTFTLHPGEDAVRVTVRLILNEYPVIVKLCCDSGLSDGKFIREVPGTVIGGKQTGRELPMQRYMVLTENGRGVAVVNDSKYSSSAANGEMRFIAARSCYYADHYGQRDERMEPQDLGEQKFVYAVMPYDGNLTPVTHLAEELNTEFPVIPETYHKGSLPRRASSISISEPNVTLFSAKPAEDGNGVIVRFAETAGKPCCFKAELFSATVEGSLQPFGFGSWRIAGGRVSETDFTELK